MNDLICKIDLNSTMELSRVVRADEFIRMRENEQFSFIFPYAAQCPPAIKARQSWDYYVTRFSKQTLIELLDKASRIVRVQANARPMIG